MPDRSGTLFLALRRVLRPADWERAFDRWSRTQPPGSVAIARRSGPAATVEQLPAETVQTSRIWMASATRWRHELDVPSRGIAVKVVDGPLWWSYAPGLHAISNESAPDAYPTQGDEPAPELTDPGAVLETLSVRERSAATRLERAVDVVRAAPDGHPHPVLARGADSYELVIDRKLELALRVSASVDGREFWLVEVTQLEVGVPLGAELFRVELPEGVMFTAPGS